LSSNRELETIKRWISSLRFALLTHYFWISYIWVRRKSSLTHEVLNIHPVIHLIILFPLVGFSVWFYTSKTQVWLKYQYVLFTIVIFFMCLNSGHFHFIAFKLTRLWCDIVVSMVLFGTRFYCSSFNFSSTLNIQSSSPHLFYTLLWESPILCVCLCVYVCVAFFSFFLPKLLLLSIFISARFLLSRRTVY